MTSPAVIGNGQGFWGDRPSAAATLVKQHTSLEYLTMDYLAELSLSIMAAQQSKNSAAGYAADVVDVVESLVPFWKQERPLKLITNAGGLNPVACAQAIVERLQRCECDQLRIAVITGDNVLDRLVADPTNPIYNHLETGQSLEQLDTPLFTANAYVGANRIVDALKDSADIVITGRVADPSLTLGACMFHHGWADDDWDRLASGTMAGHLIECGTQLCGGFSTDWLTVPDPANMGYPIVEVDQTGRIIATKPEGTGGKVTVETVKEQLLYEIGDPDAYLSPDVTASINKSTVREVGENRVELTGITGRAPTKTYKVSATFPAGYRAEGMITIVGEKAAEKARRAGEVIIQRLQREPEDYVVECIGSGDVVSGGIPKADSIHEVVLRVAIRDSDRSLVASFCKELAPLVTSGPQGTTGYASGRPRVRPVYGYWPCLCNKSTVECALEVFNVNEGMVV